MKAAMAKCPFGIFIFDEQGNILASRLYPKDPQKALELFGEKTPKELLDQLKGYELKTKSSEADSMLRVRIREIGLEIFGSHENMNEFLSEFGMAFTRSRMKKAVGRDNLIIQASNALDDINKSINLFVTRLREWYGLHYPELKLSDNELIKSVCELGARENFPKFRSSTGTGLVPEDEEILMKYAALIERMHEDKKGLEKYVKESVRETMPNFSSLIDPLLAARMLAMAGSTERLARMTASTIQLLGAEKALFRHLKQKGKPPKFGLIFYSPYVQNAPEGKRGKMARFLASKLMLAARIDYYSKRDESSRLKKELEEEIGRVLA
ncbi:MAG: hypothetical protein HZB66_01815 [Candidatus Aenigmarchaeota archaeon]|nr:hypothetical protein [Candidatus Aenigmarchaeota archaeon]